MGTCRANQIGPARRRSTMCPCRCDRRAADLCRARAGEDRDIGAREMVNAFIVFCEKKKVFGLLPFFSQWRARLLLFGVRKRHACLFRKNFARPRRIGAKGGSPAVKSSRTVSLPSSRVRERSSITSSQRRTCVDYCNLAWHLLKTL